MKDWIFENFIEFGLFATCFIMIIYNCNMQPRRYIVKITFCDNRNELTIKTNSLIIPTNYSIQNYRKGVPEIELNGIRYINVCNIESKEIH